MTIDLATLDIDGWPLANEYLVEIGRITLLWVRLENLVRNAVANFVGFDNLADPRAFIVFSRATFAENLDTLDRLCKHLLPTTPNLAGYPNVLASLGEARGAMAHYTGGGLTANPGTGAVEIDLDDPTVAGGRHTVAVELADLRRVALQIDAAQHGLYRLITAIERPDRRLMG